MAKSQFKWYGEEFKKRQNEIWRQKMMKAVLLVEREAKRLCPVVTGRLRGSITHEILEMLKEIGGRVGTNVEYGVYVEYGTSKMDAQPYLRTALENKRTEIKAIFSE